MVALADVLGCADAEVADPPTSGTLAGPEDAGPVGGESGDEEVSVGAVGDGDELAGDDG